MIDLYTKTALTVIDATLTILVAQNAIHSSAAQMDRVQKVRICNALDVCDDVIKVQICDVLHHCADLSALPSQYAPAVPGSFLPTTPRLSGRYGLSVVQDR